MRLFCLHGTDYNEKILLELNEVIDFPERTSYEGGYDIICTLQVDVGCYHVKCDRYYSATGALYRFSDSLKDCYKKLAGNAEYRLRWENDLVFNVAMTSCGHALVTGQFREHPEKNTVLTFEIETDQTCLLSVFQEIDKLQDTFGGMKGIG